MTSLKIIQPLENHIKKKQIVKGQEKILEKQGYRLVGNHSAVKICGWTKNMLNGKGGCYKYTFYGIRSHQCLQMTTSMFCASRCKFCWRGLKAPVSKSWYGPIDSPEHIINHAIDAHLSLLTGFGGNPKSTQELLEEKKDIRHAALSLTGEPITYPLINEIINAFHKRRISTFLVTNAQYPEQIEKINKVTQLYLSIDAPNKELMEKIDRPLFSDFWERMEKCLELLKLLPEYEYIREHIPSRVVLLAKKSLKKKVWINFPKFFRLLETGKEFKAEDYCSRTIMPNK